MNNEKLIQKIADLENELLRIKKSNFLYKSIFEKIPFGIQVFDNQGFSLAINPKQKELLGIPNLEEGIGKFNVLTDPFAVSTGASKLYAKAYNGEPQEHTLVYNLGIDENKWETRKDSLVFHESIVPIYNEKNSVEYTIAILDDVTEADREHKKLLESEERFRNIFHNNLAVMYVVDPETRNIVEVNKAAEKFFGYSREELLGFKIEQINMMSPEDLTDKMNKAISESNIYHEVKHKLANGEIKDVEIYTSVIQLNGKKHFCTIAHDVTERKYAEMQLKVRNNEYYALFEEYKTQIDELVLSKEKIEESERDFRLLVENAPEPIFIQTGGKFSYVNKALLELYHAKSKDQLIGQLVIDRIPEQFKNLVAERIKNLNDHKIPASRHEYQHLRLDDSLVDVEVLAVPFRYRKQDGALVFVRDITERKNAEIALEESEAKFRNLFHGHAAIKLIIDPENLSIVDANHAAAAFYGYSIEQLTQMKISEINILPQGEIEKEMIRAKEAKNIYFEFKHRKADGSVADVEVFSSRIKIGNKDYLHSIIHDATEKKENEKKIKLLIRSVEQSPVSTIITDKTGRIEYVNPKFTQNSGYTFNEVVGKNPRILKSGTHSKEVFQNLWKTILSGNDWNGELQNRRKDGRLYWIDCKISPIVDSTGQITHFISVREDITERKENARRIAEQQKLFETMFNTIADGVVITDKDRRIVHANKGMKETFGYNPDDIIGRSTEILYATNNDFEGAGKSVFNENSLKSGKLYYTYYKDKNNKVFPGETFGAKLYNDDNEWIGNLGIMRNISDRINAIKEIESSKVLAEENEKKYKNLFDNNPLPMWIYEVETLKFLNVNNAAVQKYGFSFDEFVSMTLLDIRCPEEQERLSSHLKKKKVEHSNAGYWIHKTKNSEEIIVEIVTHPVTYENKNARFVISNDVTEKVKAENEVIHARDRAEKSEKNLENIFTNSPLGIFVIDVVDGKYFINSVNPNHEKLIGLKNEELNNKPLEILTDLLGDEIYLYVKRLYDSIIATKSTTQFEESLMINGKKIEVNTVIKPLIDHHGKVYRLIGSNLDISRLKETEKELLKAKNRAEESEKNLLLKNEEYEAINEELNQSNSELRIAKEKAEESDKLKMAFLNNMSHEVRTPLNAIVGFSQFMARPSQTPEKLKKFAEMIASSSGKLIDIVTDIIEISHIQTNQLDAKFEEFELNSFFESIEKEIVRKIKGTNLNYTVHRNFPESPFLIKTDQYKLKKVLSHLIDNAIKFTPEGSIELTGTYKSGSVNILVEDTGIGIEPALHNAVFEPFRQAETGNARNYGGTGLGLTIAKAFVELMNGTISLNSIPGNGTKIEITIPAKGSLDTPVNEHVTNAPKSEGQILIAEDEDSNFLYLYELFEDKGFKIIRARNGKEAVEFCQAPNSILFVLMDIKMPVMDGYTAAKIIKGKNPGLPVIAQTAYALTHEIQQYTDIFDAYITKPVDETELKNLLKRFIEIT